MKQVITVTQDELAKAFEEWDRRARSAPGAFMSDAQRLIDETPETVGQACAQYIIGVLREQGSV